jgi:hypothetical protein
MKMLERYPFFLYLVKQIGEMVADAVLKKG